MSRRLLFAMSLFLFAGWMALTFARSKTEPVRERVEVETALRAQLAELRAAIEGYYEDRGCYPERLQDLVSTLYLAEIPTDPVTGSPHTWQARKHNREQLRAYPQCPGPGIFEIYSGAQGRGMNGLYYGTW